MQRYIATLTPAEAAAYRREEITPTLHDWARRESDGDPRAPAWVDYYTKLYNLLRAKERTEVTPLEENNHGEPEE